MVSNSSRCMIARRSDELRPVVQLVLILRF